MGNAVSIGHSTANRGVGRHDLSPHGQAQRHRSGRVRETWHLDLLPSSSEARACDATASSAADRLTQAPSCPRCGSSGYRNEAVAIATPHPINWARMNGITDPGAMPASVLLRVRAMVTAARQLSDHVACGSRNGHASQHDVGLSNHGIEMGARQWTEHQNNHDEGGAGGNCIIEQLEPRNGGEQDRGSDELRKHSSSRHDIRAGGGARQPWLLRPATARQAGNLAGAVRSRHLTTWARWDSYQ